MASRTSNALAEATATKAELESEVNGLLSNKAALEKQIEVNLSERRALEDQAKHLTMSQASQGRMRASSQTESQRAPPVKVQRLMAALDSSEHVQSNLRNRIESMETVFSDHCVEKSGLEEKHASAAHDLETSGLQESVDELEDALAQQTEKHQQEQTELKDEIKKLNTAITTREQENSKLERRVEELIGEVERTHIRFQESLEAVEQAKQTLRTSLSALQRSIESEKTIQAKLAGLDVEGLEGLELTPEALPQTTRGLGPDPQCAAAPPTATPRELPSQVENTQALPRPPPVAVDSLLTSVSAAAGDTTFAPPIMNVSPGTAPANAHSGFMGLPAGVSQPEGIVGDGEHNRTILRLFRQLLQEWFAQVPEELKESLKKDGHVIPTLPAGTPRGLKQVDQVFSPETALKLAEQSPKSADHASPRAMSLTPRMASSRMASPSRMQSPRNASPSRVQQSPRASSPRHFRRTWTPVVDSQEVQETPHTTLTMPSPARFSVPVVPRPTTVLRTPGPSAPTTFRGAHGCLSRGSLPVRC